VNFTVLIPDELKAKMDKYPDVNWSEVTRKSIQSYVTNRDNPFPPLEFELKELHFLHDSDLMQPLMRCDFKVTNKNPDTELIIDRMLFTVKFLAEHYVNYGEEYNVAQARKIAALKGVFTENLLEINGPRGTHDLSPPIELLRRLSEKMKATFFVDIDIAVYVQGYRNQAPQHTSIKVPIDEWNTEIEHVLRDYDTNHRP
jgi:hypothetical protein